MEKLLRVNMTTGTVSWDEFVSLATESQRPGDHRPARITDGSSPSAHNGDAVPADLLGGRGLSAKILLNEVPPATDPLGPLNKLIIAPGRLAGTFASSTNRISFGGKSPLTGGIKESNAGGMTALRLAQLGYRAVIIEGQAAERKLSVLVISAEKAWLERAEELRGLGTIETVKILRQRYGDKAAISLVGPAGERLLPAAGIAGTDQEGFPGRYSGRGGLGAVMAAKGLKAVVVLADGAVPRRPVDKALWDEALREYNRLLQTLPATAERFPLYGTAATLDFTNRIGALPTRNFSRGQFEQAEAISGTRLRQIILERDGEGTPTHACMPGCLVRCSNRYADKMGRFWVSPMEYETHALLGSNLEIGDFDQLAELTYLCNDLGLDTIETGAAIGVAMEAGLLPFGDFAGARRLIQEIGEGTVLGRLLGHGAAVAGRVLGVRRIPVVKGQAMPAYDPRGMKGNGVVYATSPMGADHTAGNMVAVPTDHLDPRGKVELSRQLQIQAAVFDDLGLCNFVGAVWGTSPETIARLVQGLTGEPVTVESLKDLGLDIIKTELAFNRRAGLGPLDDRLPEFMREEPLPPHNSVWDIPDEELDAIWK